MSMSVVLPGTPALAPLLARGALLSPFKRPRPDADFPRSRLVLPGLRIDLARLAALTASLPDRERDLIALRYGAGLSNRAIAPLVGLSESNVGTILQRTVQQLRERW